MQTAILTADRRFFTGGGDAPPFAAAFQRGVKAPHPGRRGSSPSTQARKERGRCQAHQPKHKMAYPLGRAAPAPPTPAIPFLQEAVDAFARAAFLESLGLRRRQGQFFPAAELPQG